MQIKKVISWAKKLNVKAKNILKDAKEKVLKDINSKKETLDKKIDEEIKKSEEEIGKKSNM